MGPRYLTRDWVELGPSYMICLPCHALLRRDKYAYLEESGENHVIMLEDGTEIKVNTTTLLALQRL